MNYELMKQVEPFYNCNSVFQIKIEFLTPITLCLQLQFFQYSRLRLDEGTGQDETSLLGTNIFNVTYAVFTYSINVFTNQIHLLSM